MAKANGLGDNLLVSGYDLSGDVGSLSKISGSVAPLEVTGINKFAPERIGGIRDGEIDFTAFFNPSPGQAHPVLSALPTADALVTYLRGTALGGDCASMVAKQINYPGTRDNAGAFTFPTVAQANAYGLEWGAQLTAGPRTDVAATNGTGIDTTASLAFGGQAYLHISAFTGTDVTVKIQDSADNITFADVAGMTFTQTTAAHTWQRLATANTATLRRYLRAATVTTGGFTTVTFMVQLVKNATAGVTF